MSEGWPLLAVVALLGCAHAPVLSPDGTGACGLDADCHSAFTGKRCERDGPNIVCDFDGPLRVDDGSGGGWIPAQLATKVLLGQGQAPAGASAPLSASTITATTLTLSGAASAAYYTVTGGTAALTSNGIYLKTTNQLGFAVNGTEYGFINGSGQLDWTGYMLPDAIQVQLGASGVGALNNWAIITDSNSSSENVTFQSSASDANTSASDAAIRLKTAVNITDGDLVMAVQDSTSTNTFTVDEQGTLRTTATKTRGTITLSAGTGTATVTSGAVCACTDTTANASVQCAVAATTLTATGTATDVIAYICL